MLTGSRDGVYNRYESVEEFFCTSGPITAPNFDMDFDTDEDGRPVQAVFCSWHQWALRLVDHIFNGTNILLYDGVAGPEPRKIAELSGSDLKDFAGELVEHNAELERTGGITLSPKDAEDLEQRLAIECQRAWLEWQKLPSYPKNPETFEFEEIAGVTQRTGDTAEIAGVTQRTGDTATNGKYTALWNAKWLEWHDECAKAGNAEPNVAILNRWNSLSDRERLEIAKDERAARPLPCEKSSDQTKAINTIKKALQRAKNGSNGAADG